MYGKKIMCYYTYNVSIMSKLIFSSRPENLKLRTLMEIVYVNISMQFLISISNTWREKIRLKSKLLEIETKNVFCVFKNK